MKIPRRWLEYVETCASGIPAAGRVRIRAEQELEQHKAGRARRLSRSLGRRKGARAERAEATGARQALRDAVLTRAAGRCEACGADGQLLELDHFFGRARSETVETCWMLCGEDHFQKTNSLPGRRFWLLRFQRHAEKHGFGKALQLVGQQLALDAARHPAAQEGAGGA